MFTKRSVVTVIILTIITCGIYGLYWYYKKKEDMYNSCGKSLGNLTPIIQFVLLFFYVGGVIFAINADDNINEVKARMGISPSDQKIAYILLELVFPIAVLALVQNEMNQLADAGTYNSIPQQF